ncbi:MAG: zinc transporter ZntB [Pseudomonadota bacterium]
MSDSQCEGALLYAFDVFPDGQGKSLSAADLDAPLSEGAAYRWVHFDINHSRALSEVEKLSDAFVAGALTLPDTRPRADAHDTGILLNLRGVNLNPESDPEDMVSIRLWVTSELIISTRIRRLMAVVEIRTAIEAGRGPDSPAEFVRDLAVGLTENMNNVIGNLSEAVDLLEDRSLDDPRGLRSEITGLRRTVIMLRRYIAPQREALARFATSGARLMDADDHIMMRESTDRVTRLVEELDALRERAAILYDQLTDARAEEMNRHMMVLSVIAAIFLPLGFLTGLLGINVGGVPMAGNPFGFAVTCIVCFILAGGLLAYFRHLKWL